MFGTVCFILSGLFTVAAINGMMDEQPGIVLIIPALAAVTLVIAGLSLRRRSNRRSISS